MRWFELNKRVGVDDMTSFLVTGGAGFIGSHLVDRLVQDGHKVRVLDNFHAGKMGNIEHNLDRIELIRGDLRDIDAVRQAVEGVEFVLHHAALHSVHESVEDPVPSAEVNIRGTLNVLVASRDAKVKRVVLASSCAVYGMDPDMPKTEEMPPDPISPYATTKLADEYYCRMFTHLYGLETVCLRYFNVFGPRQNADSAYAAVIPRFITAAMEGKVPTIYGDGLQSRDFTYVLDNVQANLLACAAPSSVAGRVMNIASGESYTLLDTLAAISKILDRKIEPYFEEARPGDIRHMEGDSSMARAVLGFEVSTAFEEGLRQMIAWMAYSTDAAMSISQDGVACD